MHNPSARRVFRFGVYEADEQTAELRKHGRRLPLQGQPLDILLLLLARPGQLVPRAEFHERLWPEGTFVDFDHSLNTAMAKIREALGDSASSPRFIETLARRGYRFIAPVEVLDPGADSSTTATGTVPDTSATLDEPAIPATLNSQAEAASRTEPHHSSTTLLTQPDELPHAPALVVRSLFLLLQVMYLCFYVISLARLSHVENAIRGVVNHTLWAVVLLVVTAVIGIPLRLYLLSAAGFNTPGLRPRFLRLFPLTFVLDEIWALAPFLLAEQIGYGLALGATAALLYVPFAQRSLILMGAGAPERR